MSDVGREIQQPSRVGRRFGRSGGDRLSVGEDFLDLPGLGRDPPLDLSLARVDMEDQVE